MTKPINPNWRQYRRDLDLKMFHAEMEACNPNAPKRYHPLWEPLSPEDYAKVLASNGRYVRI
jgi:hypothetical protein